jgi:hypothetical protein
VTDRAGNERAGGAPPPVAGPLTIPAAGGRRGAVAPARVPPPGGAPAKSSKPATQHAAPPAEHDATDGPLGVVRIGRRIATTGRGVPALIVIALVALLLVPMLASRASRPRG